MRVRWLVPLLVLLIGCTPERSQVIVYTSLDQFISEPILERFESDTGIDVRAVFDTEASKTSGLANRLVAEKRATRADVWWNS